MSTSSVAPLACPICGEVPDATKLGWGCVLCNKDKERLARQPEVPVSPGPADRVGCLQHGEVDCERCGVLAVRHQLAIEDWHPDRDRGARGLGVLLLFLLLLAMVAGCVAVVWNYYPR